MNDRNIITLGLVQTNVKRKAGGVFINSLTVFTKAILNTGFYQTLARYGNGVEIVKPEEARSGFIKYLKSVLRGYEENR